MNDKEEVKRMKIEFDSKLKKFSEDLNFNIDQFLDDLSNSFDSNYFSTIKPEAVKDGLISGSAILLQKGNQHLGFIVKVKANVIAIPDIPGGKDGDYLVGEWTSLIKDALDNN